MSRKHQSKYEIRDGQLCNCSTGEPIPEDEPVFVLRAKDMHAVEALLAYWNAVEGDEQKAAVYRRIEEFEEFAEEHPDRMKEPDTSRPRRRSSTKT